MDILVKALEEIRRYGDVEGICPYGCDCPSIAKRALESYDKNFISLKEVEEIVKSYQDACRSLNKTIDFYKLYIDILEYKQGVSNET